MTASAMPLMGHLGELRSRLIKSLLAVGVGSIIAFTFNEQILDFLVEPYRAVDPEATLAFFRPTEAFSLVMRISLWGGTLLASPVIFYQLWRFVAPALTKREKRWVIPLVAVLVLLLGAGLVVGYWSMSRGLTFLFEFGGESLEPIIGADEYLRFAMRFLLAFGVSFCFPVFVFAAAAAHVVDSAGLRRGRRWTAIIILVSAALITPTGDPLTLVLLSVPMYVLYEITILAVRFILHR
ncbi:MAG: twin-arginine translocase subunit TatC [Actinobacteria bacterium]|nr:MAG: twin-arginine translocase subunit TatC [Actinomycetota bacterium]